MAGSEEELRSLWTKWKEERERRSWPKTQPSEHEDHGSSPITSWQIDGETMGTVADFSFWSPKSLQTVTAAMKFKDTCSLEEKV